MSASAPCTNARVHRPDLCFTAEQERTCVCQSRCSMPSSSTSSIPTPNTPCRPDFFSQRPASIHQRARVSPPSTPRTPHGVGTRTTYLHHCSAADPLLPATSNYALTLRRARRSPSVHRVTVAPPPHRTPCCTARPHTHSQIPYTLPHTSSTARRLTPGQAVLAPERAEVPDGRFQVDQISTLFLLFLISSFTCMYSVSTKKIKLYVLNECFCSSSRHDVTQIGEFSIILHPTGDQSDNLNIVLYSQDGAL